MVLSNEVRERKCAPAWLALVEREYGFLMASARSIADTRKQSMISDKTTEVET